MLTALRIENFAIIDELEVRFGPGFNVLTGETGAGKSILVDALHLVLGGRAARDLVRGGTDEASVEALFEGLDCGDRLASVGLPPGDGELLVRRQVLRGGRSRVWVNGALATVGQLEQLMRGLVDISGQHEHVTLLDPSLHLGLLDAWAGLQAEAGQVQALYEELAAARLELAAARTDESERARRADYLAFQLEEFERLAPEPGEDEKLATERRRLASATRLREAAEVAEGELYSDERSAVDLLGAALGRLSEAAALDPALEAILLPLKAARVEMEEAARTLSAYARSLEADPSRLAEVDERLDALKRLTRKHGGTVETALGRAAEMRRELDLVENHAARLQALDDARQSAARTALQAALALSEKRQAAARDFGRAVALELKRLAMDRCSFDVKLSPSVPQLAPGAAPVPHVLDDVRSDPAGASGATGTGTGTGMGMGMDEAASLGPRGLDVCELLLAAGPGEEPRPLAKIASGGELSRVMLAVKRALSRLDPVPVYLFDEVDSGVGGAVAEVIGRLLKEVASERQVLCITHLPQIAALADHHFVVEKKVRKGRTVSRVNVLPAAERAPELARMLAGVEVTKEALRHAEQLLASAHRKRCG